MGSFSILLESKQAGDFRATVLGLPDCQAEGATREMALANAKQQLEERLATAEIVAIDCQVPSVAKQMAGQFKDDPEWEDFQDAIAAYRQELDAELAEEYRQMDEAERHLNTDHAAL